MVAILRLKRRWRIGAGVGLQTAVAFSLTYVPAIAATKTSTSFLTVTSIVLPPPATCMVAASQAARVLPPKISVTCTGTTPYYVGVKAEPANNELGHIPADADVIVATVTY